jgi:hypothetical protein
MADALLALSDAGRRVLKEVIDREMRKPQNSEPNRSKEYPVHTSEIYIAKVPSGGIPAMEIERGVGTNDDVYTPGEADCEIYKVDNLKNPPKLIKAGFSRKVYNVSSSSIATEFLLVSRDKYGKWVPASVGGEGPPIVMFTIHTANFCGECSARAMVIAKPVGASIPGANGHPTDPDLDPFSYSGQYWITVYDKTYPQSCFLNEPPEDLGNRVGFAVYLDCLQDGPCGDTFGPRWVIFSLCCAPPDCFNN